MIKINDIIIAKKSSLDNGITASRDYKIHYITNIYFCYFGNNGNQKAVKISDFDKYFYLKK